MVKVINLLFDNNQSDYIEESSVNEWKETLSFIINNYNDKEDLNKYCNILINKLRNEYYSSNNKK